MNNKTLGFVGSGLLVVGLFLPVASFPILGTITLMSAGLNWAALALLVLAGMSAFLVAKDRLGGLIWTGGAALLTLLFLIGRLQYSFSDMRAELAENLRDNPFAGMAQTAMASAGLQWGWIVLLLGAGALIYVATEARKETEVGTFALVDPTERLVLLVSAFALLIAPAREAWNTFRLHSPTTFAPNDGATAPAINPEALDSAASADADAADAEEAAYIRENVQIYDLTGKYYESYDGSEPGVDFKIKNNGNRTLSSVKVTVIFFDTDGKPIAEEEYYPVNVGGFSISGNDGPLRPNYIWKQERGQFYTAKSVPEEWEVGKVSAKVTDIEFAPEP